MKFLKLAILSAATPSLFAIHAGNIKSVEDRSANGVGVDGSGTSGVRGGHTSPGFLQEAWGSGSQQMCESCSRDAGCATGMCSWSFVCYDSHDGKGANGCACASDANCKSGRCASNFGCAPKVANGGRCAMHDDCAENFCGWDFHCHPLCKGEQNLPFMVTNVKLTQEGQEHYWGYHSNSAEDEFKYLKNVKYCPDAGTFYAYRIYGQLISKEQFKTEVDAFMASSPVYDHVLFNIHGFNVNPEPSFLGAQQFNDAHGLETGYFVIPINWRNVWGAQFASYERDRNTNAIQAGKSLAAQVDMFQLSARASIMCHSMGNYVFRVMAQETRNPEQVFENVFMVAADARMDMFSTEFNPDAPGASEGIGVTDMFDAQTSYADIPAEERRINGGLAITELTNHVHVAWNLGDHALWVRETFQIGFGDEVRKALGKFGGQAEALTTLPYFTERVTYHDMSRIVESFGIEHNYQWSSPLITMYEECKPEETNSALFERHFKVN